MIKSIYSRTALVLVSALMLGAAAAPAAGGGSRLDDDGAIDSG